MKVDIGKALYLSSDSSTAIDLGTNKQCTGEFKETTGDTDSRYTHILVDDGTSVSYFQIYLPSSTNNFPVGVRLQTNNVVSQWKLTWLELDDPNYSSTETVDKIGQTCTAYKNFNEPGTYTPQLTALKNSTTVLNGVEICTFIVPDSVVGGSSAVLDADADFFADLDLVDELFED